MSKLDVKAVAATLCAQLRTEFLYGILTPLGGSMRRMEDLYFVGLTLLLAALTWVGIRLCAGLLERS